MNHIVSEAATAVPPPTWQIYLDQEARQCQELLVHGYTELPHEMPHGAKLDKWLDQNMHAGMDYMPRTAEIRKKPREHFLGMQTAFVGLWKYPRALQPISELRNTPYVAAYAHGADYHHKIGQILHQWSAGLAAQPDSVIARPFVDALPVSERTLAVLAGLGFIGRSGMLIHPRFGTGFFIAGLLLTKSNTEIAQPKILPFAHGCTTCRQCIDACPTRAIDENGQVDARTCVSYLTIEHRGPFDQSQCQNASHALFGCDICQSICPYNKRHLAQSSKMSTDSFWPSTLVEWQQITPEGAGLSRRIRNTPLARSGRKGILRNLESWTEHHPESE